MTLLHKTAVLVALFFTPSSYANVTSHQLLGSELLPMCMNAIRISEGEKSLSNREIIGAVGCQYFIAAATDSSMFFEIWYRDYEICISDTVTRDQVIRVFVQYLKNNPEDREFAASELVYSALKASFPCEDGEVPDYAEGSG